MSVESILKISVEDAAFQRYKALFDAYTAEVKKQPELWAKVSKQHAALLSQWTKVANSFAQTTQHLENANDALNDQEKHATVSERLWSSMEKSSRGVASNILGATTSLLKWTGLLSGISGLLGYFSFEGLMHLGNNASSWRQSAMGLGLSTSQQRAFNIAFDRLLPGHTGDFLSGINSMVTNIGAQAPLAMLGVNPNAPTVDVAVDYLKKVRQLALNTPTDQLGIIEKMYQLQKSGTTVEDLRRYKSMSGGEFNQMLSTFGRESGALALNDRTLKTWQDFITSMDLAKGRIENVFVRGLANLAGPVQHVTTGFAHLLEVVMRKDGAIGHGIDVVAMWLERFSGDIAKPQFLSDVETFTSDFGKMARAVHGTMSFLNFIYDNPIDRGARHARSSVVGGLVGAWDWLRNDMYMHGLSKYDALRGLPAGTLETIRTIESGSSFSPATSPKGAQGVFQLMPDVAKVLGVDPNNPDQAAQGASLLVDHLYRKYHGDLAAVFAAYNWGEGNLDALMKRLGKAGDNDAWERYVPRETQDYLIKALRMMPGVTVTIENRTGSHVNASLAGQGASP